MRKRPEKEAAALLARLGIESAPVDVEGIAEALDIKVVLEDLEDDTSAMLIRRGEAALIMIDKDQAPARQRFSIAHELGHFQLHREPVFVDKQPARVNFRNGVSSLAIDPREIEANGFAAALLMPANWIYAEVEKLRTSKRPPDEGRLVKKLSNVFDVSEQAIEYRLLNLGLISSPPDKG